MVDISGMTPSPELVPDPKGCKDFAEWVKKLVTDPRYGVTQRRLAMIAHASPQAVTKWLNGGVIEIERLAHIAAWVGLPFQQLQNLLNQTRGITVIPELPVLGSSFAPPELVKIFEQLNPRNRKQLIEMAKVLQANQTPVTKK